MNKIIVTSYNKIKTDFNWKNTVIDAFKSQMDGILKDIFVFSKNSGEGELIDNMVSCIQEEIDMDFLKDMLKAQND